MSDTDSGRKLRKRPMRPAAILYCDMKDLYDDFTFQWEMMLQNILLVPTNPYRCIGGRPRGPVLRRNKGES